MIRAAKAPSVTQILSNDDMAGDEVDDDHVDDVDALVSVKTETNKHFISNLLVINIG
jgi:hypothetical protein